MKLTLEQAQKMMKETGGSLDLRYANITALPDNLTVGGSLDLSDTNITGKDKERSKVKKLRDGDYVPDRYIYADGILTHVEKRKSIPNTNYMLYVGKIKGKNVITDGVHYAHCDNFRDGIADLIFKTAKDRGAEQYKDLSLDTEMTVPELKAMYRVITGACRQGTENFVGSLGELKEKYSIREAIELTRGQYGAERFAAFFNAA